METKKIEDILKTPEQFETLLYKVLLFAKDSDYYKFSGKVTAALLNYDDPDKEISILAIRTPEQWYTFKSSKDDLRKMLGKCIEVVGNSEEESFTLE